MSTQDSRPKSPFSRIVDYVAETNPEIRNHVPNSQQSAEEQRLARERILAEAEAKYLRILRNFENFKRRVEEDKEKSRTDIPPNDAVDDDKIPAEEKKSVKL